VTASGEAITGTVAAWVERLLDAAASGRALDLRSGDDDDVAQAAGWGEERTVPAEALAAAFLRPAAGPPPTRLWLQGARVDGTLDLAGQKLDTQLVLEHCHFAEPLMLRATELASLTLSECVIAGLDAKNARIKADLKLSPNMRCDGGLHLKNAHVEGDLLLHGTFTNSGGVVISAANVRVDGDAGCAPGFRAEGEVQLGGARVTGVLALTGSRFSNPGAVAIAADQIRVDGMLFCDDGFEAEGEVRLLGARVGNQIAFLGAHFRNPRRDALSADGIVVDGDVFCRDGFEAEGEVRLLGARIAGDLSLRGGRFINPGEKAISGDRMIVGGGVFCGADFVAEGEVRLPSAHVHSNVQLTDGRFRNPGGCAINADRLTVDGNISCRDAFAAEGAVHFIGVRVGGQLALTGTLRGTSHRIALDLEDARITRMLLLHPAAPLEGRVDLTNATVAQLADSDEAWAGGYELRGFRYQVLADEQQARAGGRSGDVVRRRLAWLHGSRSGYHPQIYEQLAEQYRIAGNDVGQRAVLIQKQRHRRRQAGALTRVWSVVEDLLVGYGYRTWQAVIPWIAAVIFGALFFHAHRHEIVQRMPRQRPPTFHALTYTLDLLLPVVNLGQRDNWVAQHQAQTVATILILAGWVLTTAILAALTGLVRRTN